MTDRQAEILAYVTAYVDRWEVSPTVREIAEEFGINPSAVHRHLTCLRRDGHLDWDDGLMRTLRVTP